MAAWRAVHGRPRRWHARRHTGRRTHRRIHKRLQERHRRHRRATLACRRWRRGARRQPGRRARLRADARHGGAGRDRLEGGIGNDILTGGAGADAFGFLSAADGNDLIQDFRRAEGDKINLSGIDADPLTAGDQAFVFADGAASGGRQPGTVRATKGADTTTIEADTGAGVLTFRVQGVVSFAADDFIL